MSYLYTNGGATMNQQTTTHRRGANHGLHLVISLLTCGFWAITGWPIAAIMGRKTVERTNVPQPPAPYYPPNPYQR